MGGSRKRRVCTSTSVSKAFCSSFLWAKASFNGVTFGKAALAVIGFTGLREAAVARRFVVEEPRCSGVRVEGAPARDSPRWPLDLTSERCPRTASLTVEPAVRSLLEPCTVNEEALFEFVVAGVL